AWSGDACLQGEGLYPGRLLPPLVGVLVADGAGRLASVAAGADGVGLGGADDGVAVAGGGLGLGRGDEARAKDGALRAEGERGDEAAAVGEAAGGDDGDANGVDGLRDERHATDFAGV